MPSTSNPLAGAAGAAVRSGLRADIQALRGWAVLLVVLHHAHLLPPGDAGYLGVDIFFVISGFVITQLLIREMQSGQFSFARFYARRARRLLPAAYVTFLAAAAVAPFFLLSDELRFLMHQELGALTFTANVVLWAQTGYFAPEAQFKPLLHTWSLAIEEQFYLLWPLALAWVPRKWWAAFALAGFGASLLLCLVLNAWKPGVAFYMLPTRAWELGLGCIGALAWRRQEFAWKHWHWLLWPAAAIVALLPMVQLPLPRPGVAEALACTATLVLLMQRGAGAPRWLAPLARVGDMSYALYLVHWPLFSFAANASISEAGAATRVGLVAAAFLLAAALHMGVEEPGRRLRWNNRATLLAAAGAGALVALFAVGVSALTQGDSEALAFRRSNTGLSDACMGQERFTDAPDCRYGEHPRMLLFGDSTAMHLADALRASSDGGFVQATKTVCGPLLGMSIYRMHDEFNRQWAKGCLQFQQSVLAWLAHQPGIEVVVLASSNQQYLSGSLISSEGADIDAGPDARGGIAAGRLAAMAQALHAMGKRVVIVESIPTAGFDVGRCLALRLEKRVVLGAPTADCSIDRTAWESAAATARGINEEAARASGVPLVRLADTLCDSVRCRATAEGVPLYQDGGHLSHAGSEWLGRHMQLYSRLWSAAR